MSILSKAKNIGEVLVPAHDETIQNINFEAGSRHDGAAGRPAAYLAKTLVQSLFRNHISVPTMYDLSQSESAILPSTVIKSEICRHTRVNAAAHAKFLASR